MRKFISLITLIGLLGFVFLCGCSSSSEADAGDGETNQGVETGETNETADLDSMTDEERFLYVMDSPAIIAHNNRTYLLNPDITTFLFLVVDEATNETPYIIFFVLDDYAKTIDFVKVPADLMVDGGVYVNGEFSAINSMPISSQYSQGDSNEFSSILTRTVVRRAINGNRIENVCAISYEGIKTVVDYLGGVDVILRNDWTDINSEYTTHSTINVTGESLDAIFASSTDGLDPQRLNRNDWFILSLFFSLVRDGGDDVYTLLEVAGDEYYSDIELEILNYIDEYSIDMNYVLPDGNTSVDELNELLIELFYTESELG